MPYAEPFTFLCLRFVFVILLMLPLAFVLHVRWPSSPQETGHIAVSGALLQGGYLGGCYAAIYHGMPAGMVALIVGLQPIVTAFAAAPLLGERVGRMQWLGLTLGFGGVLLVVWEKLAVDLLTGTSIAWAVLALVGITAGTVYQKRYCPSFDLRAGSLIQFGTALLLSPLTAVAGQPGGPDFTPGFYRVTPVDRNSRASEKPQMLCAADAHALLRLGHGNASGCHDRFVQPGQDRTTVTYSCPAGGWEL